MSGLSGSHVPPLLSVGSALTPGPILSLDKRNPNILVKKESPHSLSGLFPLSPVLIAIIFLLLVISL